MKIKTVEYSLQTNEPEKIILVDGRGEEHSLLIPEAIALVSSLQKVYRDIPSKAPYYVPPGRLGPQPILDPLFFRDGPDIPGLNITGPSDFPFPTPITSK